MPNLINNYTARSEAFAPGVLVRGECPISGFYFGRVLSVGPKTYRIQWDYGMTERVAQGNRMIRARVA